MHVGHQGGVGFGGVTGPKPDKAVLFDDGEAAHTGGGVQRFLAGHVGAAVPSNLRNITIFCLQTVRAISVRPSSTS